MPHAKFSWKWILYLRIGAKIIKLLEENVEVNIWVSELSKALLDRGSKAQVKKEKKKDKFYLRKLKMFMLQRIPSRKWRDDHRMG